MAQKNYIVSGDDLTNVADAIRETAEIDEPLTWPTEYISQIRGIGADQESAHEAADRAEAAATEAAGYATQAGNSATASANSATQSANSATQAGQSATNASGSANSAEDSAEDAEAWAIGERNGTPVEETDETYENNAKYYAGVAEGLVEAAAHSVRYDTAQTLTNNQKAQARENINAAAPDGSYGGMTVGYAEQLTSSIVETDEVPYLFRTAGGNAEIGSYEEDTIVGGSVAWNQQIDGGDFSDSSKWAILAGGTLTVADNEATIAITANFGGIQTSSSASKPTDIVGHKYLITADIKASVVRTNSVGFGLSDNNSAKPVRKVLPSVGTTYSTYAFVGVQNTETVAQSNARFMLYDTKGSDGVTLNAKNIMSFDLTQMFGTTIADYVYSLEQASAGSGIEWLKGHGFFTEDYYPYNAGSMKHVSGLVSHQMVGFNAWDEEWELGTYSATTGEKIASNTVRCKNKIEVLPSTQYYLNVPYNIGSLGTYVFFYDASENFVSSIRKFSRTLDTPQNARYMTFACPASYGTTYKNDICINLRWDGERDGEYEAYRKESYALDSTVTLRGIPKLDASNNLYYDGDRYLPDGTVRRRFKELEFTESTSWTLYNPLVGINTFNARITNSVPYVAGVLSNYYTYDEPASHTIANQKDKTFYIYRQSETNCRLSIRDDDYTDVASFRSHMAGVFGVFEIEPTTETADPYTNPQWVDNWGTEEYVVTPDADGFQMPVGHSTNYPVDLKAKLEATANNPQTDGIYLLQYQNGEATYTPLASDTTITDILARLTALEQQTTQEG